MNQPMHRTGDTPDEINPVYFKNQMTKNILSHVAGMLGAAALFCAGPVQAQTAYAPPSSPHADFNFNPGWKFIRADVTNAMEIAFDDSKWTDVSAPHTYNDVDSYTAIISHSGGDRHAYAGVAWYRKNFKLPPSAKDGKV